MDQGMTLTHAQIAELACFMEALCPKPGNVYPGRPFKYLNEMSFVVSAMGLAEAFSSDETAGRLALRAARSAKKLVGRNANLGIILLLAPLVRAAGKSDGGGRRSAGRASVRQVLEDLGPDDSEAIYEAIRILSPEGLGKSSQYDVNGAGPVPPILDAMKLASGWDSVAGEYASGYEITFGLAAPAISSFRNEGHTLKDSILQAFLTVLAEVPDTLTERKLGRAAAERTSALARSALLAGGCFTGRGRDAISEMDRELRDADNLKNPGATADLIAAGIFVFLSEELRRTPLTAIVDRWDEHPDNIIL
ncbi:MAG: triphosphoribosyl-dephospho-CoA synthase [Synergistaceae bacterium]|jgi:triphosphoribosyl-dephospho-CoA synthase|nr:triphosphoribosyl-dephospho-CoA synthase [Synergistaceae bacterium]